MKFSDEHKNCACCHVHPAAVKIEEVSVKLGGVNILENVCFHVPQGVCTAIVGPNGAGKTTLVKALLGDVTHTGKILFRQKNREDFSEKRPVFGYVPQRLQFDRLLPLTVMEFLACSFCFRPVFFGISRSFRSMAEEYLNEVDCIRVKDRKLGALSGGELQRVLLALALMRKPEILILDEPAAGVDFKGEKLCCELLEMFRKKQNFTQIMVSHDLSTVAAHAAHVVCINHQVYAEGDPEKVLTSRALLDTFGLHMGMVDLHKNCHCSGTSHGGGNEKC
ncbi:MAG: metal ABC transporter ATP-binding protein [Lentisphaeria bacterium]|nr:metal ABC transporter ATP-binding protein [Lentisphaeria bacterium]